MDKRKNNKGTKGNSGGRKSKAEELDINMPTIIFK